VWAVGDIGIYIEGNGGGGWVGWVGGGEDATAIPPKPPHLFNSSCPGHTLIDKTVSSYN